MSGPKDAATSASTFSTAAGTYPTPPLSPANDHTPRRPLHHTKRLDRAPLTGPDGVLSGVVEAALERVSNPGRFTLLIWPLIKMEVADCLCSHDVVF